MGVEKPRACVLNAPNEEDIEKIKKKLGEDEDKLKKQLFILYKWLDTHPNLPKNYDKNKVMNFLRACKYDMEKCKKKLQSHFFVRHEYPSVFSKLNPRSKEITNFPEIGNSMIFPNITPNGERLFFLSLHDLDVDKMDVHAYVKYAYMCYDLALREPFPVVGDVMIMDGTGFQMKHFLKCINTAVKESLEVAYKGYLIRLRAIYIVNAPPAIDKMVATWKLFLTEKMKNRVVVSRNFDILTKNFPLNCLPEEYGGTLPRINEITRKWHQAFLDNEQWFQEQEKCKTTVPPMKEDTIYDDRFGVDGTFRKLTID